MARHPLPKDTELRGRYRVDTVLGAGGFGITYVGQDLLLGRSVAIKEYFPADHAQREGHYTVRSLDTANRQFFALGRTWFLREARTLAKYHHPNIVGVMDHFEENGTAYMILRFEEGQSLSRWLRSLGRAPTQFEVDGFMLPILSALETMHTNNDMHRDVAMDNIILRPNGDPVLIDFGSARQAIGAHSRSIDAVVKFGYSPPEQYSVDTRLQGPWSDVYALASTLHLAITGKLPPDAPGRQIDDIYQPLAQSGLEGYRIGLLEGIDWGLALKPSQRPQSISAWRRVLMQSTHEPLDEDPVELLNGRPDAASATLRTPSPATAAHATAAARTAADTSGDGTVFVERTQASSGGRSQPRASGVQSAVPGGAIASGGITTGGRQGNRNAPSRPPSARVSQRLYQTGPNPSPDPERQANGDAFADAPEHAETAPRPMPGFLTSGYLDLALLCVTGLCGVLLFRNSHGLAADVPVTPVEVALVAGYGLSLAGLIGRQLLLGDPAAARSRAMLALGLVWLPTVILTILAIPFFALAYTMSGGKRPWHAPVLNVAGGLHIMAGVLLLFAAMHSNPMFVLALSLSLIGLGFLTLLTTRTSLDANT